jgi:hypothetical protein
MIKLDAKFRVDGVVRKVKDNSIVLEDEFVVFLAKDNAFHLMLPIYRATCEALGADEEQLAAVDRLIERVDMWRIENFRKCKVPDAKGERLADVEDNT